MENRSADFDSIKTDRLEHCRFRPLTLFWVQGCFKVNEGKTPKNKSRARLVMQCSANQLVALVGFQIASSTVRGFASALHRHRYTYGLI
jgi:hypothetical protein